MYTGLDAVYSFCRLRCGVYLALYFYSTFFVIPYAALQLHCIEGSLHVTRSGRLWSVAGSHPVAYLTICLTSTHICKYIIQVYLKKV